VLVSLGLRAGGAETAGEREHLDENRPVIVNEARVRLENFDVTPELFADFAHERGGGSLPGLDFAAGEFPFEREVLVRRTLGDEHVAVTFDDGASDGNGASGGHGGGLGARELSARIVSGERENALKYSGDGPIGGTRLTMSSARLSLFGGWWARLFGRAASSQTPADAFVSDLAKAPAVLAPAAPTTPSPEEIAAQQAAMREQGANSLKEMLLLDTLPAAVIRQRKADPLVRERTLEALGNLRQIPALQSLAQGFMQALNRPEVEVDEVVGAISKDSALCVRVLRQANSVLIASERRIEDLDTAVQMLGVARVRKAAHALFTLRDAKRVAEGFDWRHLWIHALGAASIAEELEQHLRSAGNSQLHLAALLHDVGKIVLSTIASEDYRDVLVSAWNENARLEDLERERFGVDHREAGVLFARHNGLPEVVIQSIAHHDRPELAESHQFDVALVAIANYVSKAHGLGFSGARLDASDGEFENLPAWKVVEEETGGRPNIEAIEMELRPFIRTLRVELRELRDGT
jgi:putative nucleotidyltransferase with HDIG domain